MESCPVRQEATFPSMMVNQEKGQQGKRSVLSLTVIISISSNQRSSSRGKTRMIIVVQRKITSVPTTSGISEKMLRVVSGLRHLQCAFNMAESRRTTRTFMLQTDEEDVRRKSRKTRSRCPDEKETPCMHKDKHSEKKGKKEIHGEVEFRPGEKRRQSQKRVVERP